MLSVTFNVFSLLRPQNKDQAENQPISMKGPELYVDRRGFQFDGS